MGYLDDAIREHLELKRRRGASRDELERAESEAFGPIVAASIPEQGSSTASAAAAQIELDDPVDQPTRAYSIEEVDAALAPRGADDHVEPQLPQPHHDDADELQRAWKEEGEPRDPHAADRDETADELEQTPDFLQETPEHDRLWFEQKAPKKFEF